MIVLLAYTIESQGASVVAESINSSIQQHTIEQLYNAKLGIVDVIENAPDMFDEAFIEYMQQADYSSAIRHCHSIGKQTEYMMYTFDSIYGPLFSSLSTTSSNTKMVLTCPAISYKPKSVDVYIGWSTHPSEYGIDHMNDHEKINTESAHMLTNTHVKWMEDNQHIFDVFLNGYTTDQVIDYIRKL